MENPILSICIPTFNRCEQLRNLLDAILGQKWFSNNVEILVYDDPSTDGTESMMNEYTKKYWNIRYHRNSIRIGMMPSILDSILKCSWKYVWLFGSDDMIWPSWLETTISLIQLASPDLLLNNYWMANAGVFSGDTHLSYELFNGVAQFCDYLVPEKKRGVETLDDTQSLNHQISYFSYMSVYCFRSDIFRKSYDSMIVSWLGEYLRTHYFNYIYILLWGHFIERICLCTSPHLTYNQWGAVSWKMNLKILKNVFSIFSIIRKDYVVNNNAKNVFRKIFLTWLSWLIETELYSNCFTKFLREKCSPLYKRLLIIYRGL